MARILKHLRTDSGRRRGNTILEAALVLPILLSISFGAVEFGYFLYIKHTIQSAAREGCRQAILATATNTDVITAVGNTMTAAGIPSSKYTVTLSPSTISTAASGTSVSVTVSCAWSAVGVRPLGLIDSTKQVTGTTVMRRE